MFPGICNYPQTLRFCCNFGDTRKNNTFCRQLANTRLTKELKAFFAFAESLPTSATLPSKVTILNNAPLSIRLK